MLPVQGSVSPQTCASVRARLVTITFNVEIFEEFVIYDEI